MLHILCKRCKSWIPRKRGKHAYTYSVFKTRIVEGGTRQIRCFCGRWTYDPRGSVFYGTKEQIETLNQEGIAKWKLEHGYAENDSPNSLTREELMMMLLNKERLREELSKEYLETFGEYYDGNILEDVVLDLKSKRTLEKLAGQI